MDIKTSLIVDPIALVDIQDNSWTINKTKDALLITNNKQIDLTEDFKGADAFYNKLIDIGIRIATPSQYAVFVTQMCFDDEERDCNPNVFVVNGVIDSGYRGIVKALIYHHSFTKTINAHSLKLKLPLLKLSNDLIPIAPNLHSLSKPTFENFLYDFYSIFNKKRDEDAGYDISSPQTIQIEPGYSYFVTIPIFQLDMENPPIACIFGRSSMNLKGLIVLPTIWKPRTRCQFFIKNVTRQPIVLKEGQRIAQLVLIDNTQSVWLQPQINCYSLFPKTSNSSLIEQSYSMWRFTKNFNIEAPNSLRGANGFGSTGI
ncbi:deoxyuridine triphosphatase-like protein [Phocid alphaherpesvirus 1]|uniref:Deoxyuridine triphosphatase-like protein n=1 Tax=Phocid alphaherpesvirus 1 TaxID=47418 RepID=A0A482F4F4_9ALPH|nr:deoxyuridine triphosphatase-like protein [Phocid alphaherpesvirus 1]QBN85170.1 deoxyuridine triphosphatase-like protein [Phocid alphaherpesvirus 1]UNP64229.1 deoxyuridine triphosphatase-like protein [Phocid alphaherpesvirus 1]